MLKTKFIILSMLLLSVSVSPQAQTRKKANANKPKTEKTDEQERAEMMFESMLPSTARITVIDSMVVDSHDLMKSIPLNKESGTIGMGDAYPDITGQPASTVYINGFGNRVFYSKTDGNGLSRLYMADKLGGKWANEKLLSEFGDEFEDISYPYMMPDGNTLYFSAKGKEGLGGYDIYVTRYDTDSARFYKPENIGLPYNSTGNDYYCIIDDFNDIGWIATDRRQPAGKVCIYTFIPSNTRNVYDEETIGEDKLESLARLESIRDTWTDEKAVEAARVRLSKLLAHNSQRNAGGISFIVNDNTVYTSVNDFKSATNRQKFTDLQKAEKALEKAASELDTMRMKYSSATAGERKTMAADLTRLENLYGKLCTYVHETGKEIRNAENLIIQKQ